MNHFGKKSNIFNTFYEVYTADIECMQAESKVLLNQVLEMRVQIKELQLDYLVSFAEMITEYRVNQKDITDRYDSLLARLSAEKTDEFIEHVVKKNSVEPNEDQL